MSGGVAGAANHKKKMTIGIKCLHTTVHRVGHKQAAVRIGRGVRGEIELAWVGAAPAEAKNKITPQIKHRDAVPPHVGDKQPVPQNGQAGWPPQIMIDLEQEFAGSIEGQHLRQPGISHEQRIAPFGDRHRGDKMDFPGRVPAMPFFAGLVVKTNHVCSGVCDAQATRLIQRKAKWVDEFSFAHAHAGDPVH